MTILRFGNGEQQFVFPVTAYAGSADLLGELDDAWRIGAFGYHIASQHEVVVLMVEVDLLEKMLQFLPAAMDIANEDKSAMLLRQVLLIHVADLYHAFEFRSHIAAVNHSWYVVHGVYLHLVCRPLGTQVCKPTDYEENSDYEICATMALYPPRDSIGCACDCRLKLRRNQKIVVACVETVFFV
jgi:hypothetical protein